jgi:hypothetical protein
MSDSLKKQEKKIEEGTQVVASEKKKSNGPNPQPGKHTINIKVTQLENSEAVGSFAPSIESYQDVTTHFAKLAGEYEAKGSFNPDEVDVDAFELRVKRMAWFTLAKKLACSLDPDAALKFDSVMKPIYQAKLMAPAGFVTLVNGYGFIDDPKEGRWKMQGQAALAMDLFLKATAADVEFGDNNREDVMCVNLAMPNALEELRALMLNIINGWSATLGEVDMNFGGGTVMRGFVPVLTGTGSTPHSVITNGLPKTLPVERAYQIAIAIDVVLLRDPRGIPNDMERGVLEGARIRMLTWNRDERDRKIGAYATDVQLKVHRTLNKVTNFVEVQKFTNQGKLWQLTQKVNETHAFSPVEQVADGLEFGTLLAGYCVVTKPVQDYELLSDESQRMRKVVYAQNMVKIGKQ